MIRQHSVIYLHPACIWQGVINGFDFRNRKFRPLNFDLSNQKFGSQDFLLATDIQFPGVIYAEP